MGSQTEPMLFLLLGWGESIKRRAMEPVALVRTAPPVEQPHPRRPTSRHPSREEPIMTVTTRPNCTTPVSITTMPSPIGELTIGASDLGVRFVMWHDDPRPQPDEGDTGGDPSRRQAVLDRKSVV